MFALGLFYLYVGVVGIGIQFGGGWATGAILAAIFLRFSLPLALGAFFYASSVWGWGTIGSLAFAFPLFGLQLLLFTGNLFSIISDKFKNT